MARGYTKIRFVGGKMDGKTVVIHTFQCVDEIHMPGMYFLEQDKQVLLCDSGGSWNFQHNKNLDSYNVEVYEKEVVIDDITKYNFAGLRAFFRCSATTKAGRRCMNFIANNPGFCQVHSKTGENNE